MIKLLGDDDDSAAATPDGPGTRRKREPAVIGLFDSTDQTEPELQRLGSASDEPFILSSAQPESTAETVRRSGLAWSMGVVFFGSVVFMLVLGWGADLLFGSSPWGMVVGIVLGSIIGFVQFFRISSQIFNK